MKSLVEAVLEKQWLERQSPKRVEYVPEPQRERRSVKPVTEEEPVEVPETAGPLFRELIGAATKFRRCEGCGKHWPYEMHRKGCPTL